MPSLAIVYRRPGQVGHPRNSHADRARRREPSLLPPPALDATCTPPLLFKSKPARRVAFPRLSAIRLPLPWLGLLLVVLSRGARGRVPVRRRRRELPPTPGDAASTSASGRNGPGFVGTKSLDEDDGMRCAADSVTFSDSNMAGGMLLECAGRGNISVFIGAIVKKRSRLRRGDPS